MQSELPETQFVPKDVDEVEWGQDINQGKGAKKTALFIHWCFPTDS